MKLLSIALITFITLVTLITFGQNPSSGSNYGEQGGTVLNIGGTLKIGGTAVTATATEINSKHVDLTLANLATANSTNSVASPAAGTVNLLECVVEGGPDSNNYVWLQINGVGVTGSSTLIDGAAAENAQVTNSSMTALNTVTVGDKITLITDGGGSTDKDAWCTVQIGL